MKESPLERRRDGIEDAPLPSLAVTGGWLRAVAVSNDGALLAAAGEDRCVYLWSTETWKMHRLGDHSSWVLSLAFLPDGRHLVSCSFDHHLVLWDALTREKVLQRRFSVPLTAMAVHGPVIWLGDEQGKLHRLNLPELQEIHALSICTGAIGELAVSQDGSVLACASGEDKVTLWDLQQNKLWERLKGHRGAVRSVSFDGPVLYSGGADRSVNRWLWKDGQPAAIGHHQGTVWQVRFAPGRGVLSAGGDKAVCLWQPDGSRQKVVGHHSGEVRALAFTSSWVASAGQDCQVRLWPWPNGGGD